jgi:hypothetical protein
MAEPKILLCIKWGEKYGPEYVNRLYDAAKLHVSAPFDFVCLTDDSEGLDPAIVIHPIPELGCPTPIKTRGNWKKVALWGKELSAHLTGTVLFLDLDSIIVDNIDCYFSFGSPEDIILERNWARPFSGLGQTSVFRFPIGSHPEILKNFQKDPQAIADQFGFEQHYITHSTKSVLKFWPRGWTRHFRLHCLGPMPWRLLRPAVIPKGSRIITFPGGPNPSEAMVGKWAPSSPPYQGRRQHLLRVWTEKKPSLLRKFVMPTPWIKALWGNQKPEDSDFKN